MASVTQDIRAALQGRVVGTSGFPASVAYEGDKTFTPAVGAPYAKLYLIPASRRPLTVSGGRIEHRGLFQVSLFAENGLGSGAIEALGDAVCERVRPGSAGGRLAAGADVVAIEYAERTQALGVDDDWVMVAVTIGWVCHSTRA